VPVDEELLESEASITFQSHQEDVALSAKNVEVVITLSGVVVKGRLRLT
jgi:hypothetical protein